jgi:hypothetical protein
MTKQPEFIREFAKKQSDDAEALGDLSPRQELARQIHEKRNEAFDRDKTLVEKRQELEELADNVAYISENVPRIISNYFKLRKLKAELASKTLEHQDLAMADAEKQIDGTPEEFQLAEQMLVDYQQKMEQEWAEGDYTKEEVEKYFTEEYLSSLSTEDYIELLQRFPASVVTHVTRQGLRDHNEHFWHMKGVGETTDSFKDMLQDSRLRPSWAMIIRDDVLLRQHVAELFCKKAHSEEQALEALHGWTYLTIGLREAIADKMAVHYYANEVANISYGAETGNEVFIIYPSMLVASQCLSLSNNIDKFNYKVGPPSGMPEGENDVYVWDEKAEGFSLDAGIVFLPKSTQVDSETGSKYEFDESGKPKPNESLINDIANVCKTQEYKELIAQARDIDGQLNHPEQKAKYESICDQLTVMMTEGTGMKLEEARYIVFDKERVTFNYPSFGSLRRVSGYDPETFYSKISHFYFEDRLKKLGLFYETKSDSTITAEEYWEQYFIEHPDQRPAHIVYYDGDPTEALLKWQKDNGIMKEAPDEYLGQESHYVHDVITDERLDPIIERYIKLVEVAIHEHYKRQEAEVAA